MDKIILDYKMGQINTILKEGVQENCINIVCDLIYKTLEHKDLTRKLQETEFERGIIDDKVLHQQMERAIVNQMEKHYQKSPIPHHSVWKKDEYKFCFTHLDTIEDKYIDINPGGIKKPEDIQIDEEQKKKQEERRRKAIYYEVMYNKNPVDIISDYYDQIKEAIENSSAFFKKDIAYIILQELWVRSEAKVEYDADTIFDDWEREYNFLKFPEIVIADADKWNKKNFGYIKKRLEEKGIFPYQYKLEQNNEEKQCFRMQEANLEFQIALIYYPEFRSVCLGNKQVEYSFKIMNEVIKNINRILETENTNDIEEMIFPYLVERIMGVNLCLEFVRYYETIVGLEKGKSNIKVYLRDIFKKFCTMPNVFSRVYILKELLEPVIFFDQERETQLIKIKKVVNEMNKMYSEYVERILKIFKQLPQKQQNEYVKEIQKKCRDWNGDSELYVKKECSYLFVETHLDEKENKRYKNIQKEYINNLLYYK